MTDSEQVPWGKGEKNPFKGSEIDPEIQCFHAIEAYWWNLSEERRQESESFQESCFSFWKYFLQQSNGVPFA